MNFNQLHYFVETAAHLNLSKAAERLYISQPALSRQIQALEDSLGVTLFQRSNRGLTLTPAGQLLLDAADQLFRQERELIYRLRSANSDTLAQIKIGFTNDVFSQKLNNFILHYTKNHSPQKFLLSRYNWLSLRNAASRCATDLIFCISNGIEGIPDLVTHTLLEAHNNIVLPRNHPLACQSVIHMHDLRDTVFIFPNGIFKSGPLEVISACAKYGFQPTISYEHAILDSVLLDVAMGRGTTVLMPGLLPTSYEADLVTIPCPDLSLSKFVVAWNKSLVSPQLLSIIEAVKTYPWF